MEVPEEKGKAARRKQERETETTGDSFLADRRQHLHLSNSANKLHVISFCAASK